jgi:hypothetical protein
LLGTFRDTFHGLNRNLWLDLVAVKCYGGDEWDLEGLLDE